MQLIMAVDSPLTGDVFDPLRGRHIFTIDTIIFEHEIPFKFIIRQ